MYRDVPRSLLPRGECLKDTLARCAPFWRESVLPELQAGRSVLIAAHGHSIRALVKQVCVCVCVRVRRCACDAACALPAHLRSTLITCASDVRSHPQLDSISDEGISSISMPNGIPLVYRLDEQLRPIRADGATGELSGVFLGDDEKVRAADWMLTVSDSQGAQDV